MSSGPQERSSGELTTPDFEELQPPLYDGDARRFHGTKLQARRVEIAAPMQIKGDKERREQMELALEEMVEERLRRAAAKAHAMEDEAGATAQTLISEAEVTAAALIADGQARQDAIRELAYNEGFEAGFQAGHTEATTKVETDTVNLLTGMQTLVQGAYLAEKQALSRFQDHAMAIVQHVSERVLYKKLDESPEALLGMIEEAIESLYLSGRVRVVVSMATLQNIRSFTAKSEEALATLSRFEFVGDPAIALHEIFVIGESASYCLTPSVQTQKLLAPLEGKLPVDDPAVLFEPIQAGGEAPPLDEEL